MKGANAKNIILHDYKPDPDYYCNTFWLVASTMDGWPVSDGWSEEEGLVESATLAGLAGVILPFFRQSLDEDQRAQTAISRPSVGVITHELGL